MLFLQSVNDSLNFCQAIKKYKLLLINCISYFRYDSDVAAYKQKVKDDIAEINNKLYEDVENEDPHAFRLV